MRFLIVKDNKITSDHCGNSTGFTNVIIIPENFTGLIGQDIREFDDEFNQRPLLDCVNDNLIELPNTHKIVDNEIVAKTLNEQYKDGIKELPIGTKIKEVSISEEYPDGLSLVQKTLTEQVNDSEITLNEAKTFVKNQIKFYFEDELQTGKFQSTALGIEVDCRRGDVKNDLQNVQGLLSYLERNDLTETLYKGYNESCTATIGQLTVLIEEMEDYGLMLYQKKHSLEDQIDSATTVGDIEIITW